MLAREPVCDTKQNGFLGKKRLVDAEINQVIQIFGLYRGSGSTRPKSSRPVSQLGLGSTWPGVDSIVTFVIFGHFNLINVNIFSN